METPEETEAVAGEEEMIDLKPITVRVRKERCSYCGIVTDTTRRIFQDGDGEIYKVG